MPANRYSVKRLKPSNVFDAIKAIGALAVIGVLWIGIPIAAVVVGISFAAYIVFMLLLDHFKDEPKEEGD